MNLIFKRLHGLYQYKDLLQQLVLRDLKLKYRRSFLGYLWSVLNPLLTMMVMVAVFSTMFKRNIENFPVYLLTGQIMYNFMNQSTQQAIHSITSNSALIKKCYVPKYIFTLSKITSGLLDFIFSLGALILVMLITQTRFTLHFLLAPLIGLELYIFCVGLGLFLAQANVFFRDIQYIYSVILTAWLYLTPIFYPLEALPARLSYLISTFNPLYCYITQFRYIVLNCGFPPIELVLKGFGLSIFILLIGTVLFSKNQENFILYI